MLEVAVKVIKGHCGLVTLHCVIELVFALHEDICTCNSGYMQDLYIIIA